MKKYCFLVLGPVGLVSSFKNFFKYNCKMHIKFTIVININAQSGDVKYVYIVVQPSISITLFIL